VRVVLTFAAAFVLLAWSIVAIGIDGRTEPLLGVAQRIETNGTRDVGYLAGVDRLLGASPVLAACPRDFIRSAVTIKLARLDVAYRSGIAADWASVSTEADRLLRAGLRCFPQDGNLWLRLAMVEFARAGPTNDAELMVRLSGSTAPNEGWIMVPRVAFAAKLLDFRPGLREVLQKDIRTLVLYGRPWEVGALYFQVGEQARQVFEEIFASPIEVERRTALQAAIDAISQSLPPERRP
jgi:hypothetical protein